ncbi:MAG: phage integrase SAM-like domain-containing protein [Planctomycetaceae bacterium]|nr:phage integrase SAM-like domain-containing protein [Planctomycetaceae bacterium]
MASKNNKGQWRISFSDGSPIRREISLCREFDEYAVTDFEHIVKLLAGSKRLGVSITPKDMKRVNDLPQLLRDKLIAVDLIEPNPDEYIPILSNFIEQYSVTRSGQTEAVRLRDKRFFNYLREYFGDKRIDKITPIDAEGLRDYLVNKRTAGHGKLARTSANKVIREIKAIFNFAVNCVYLKVSPFANIKGGSTSNPERQHYIDDNEMKAAIQACGNDVELARILVFARYAGLRVPSEIRDLKFSDFETVGIFNVPQSGKTGKRRVPFFEEIEPYYSAIKSAMKDGQEYVFAKYRTCKNVGTLIKKKMQKAGLKIWEKFFVNLRSSCITDKERLRWSRSSMDAVFGNSEAIRLTHYIQPMPDDEYAQLGKKNIVGNKNVKSFAGNTGGSDFIEYCKMIAAESGQEIPASCFTFSEKLSDGFTLNDIWQWMGLDSKRRDELTQFFLSDPDLAYAPACLNAITENTKGKTFDELTQTELYQRCIGFVQKMTTHFEKGLQKFIDENNLVGQVENINLYL